MRQGVTFRFFFDQRTQDWTSGLTTSTRHSSNISLFQSEFIFNYSGNSMSFWSIEDMDVLLLEIYFKLLNYSHLFSLPLYPIYTCPYRVWPLRFPFSVSIQSLEEPLKSQFNKTNTYFANLFSFHFIDLFCSPPNCFDKLNVP